MFKPIKKLLFVIAFSLTLTNCTIGTYTPGLLYQLTSRSLSLNNANLRTCVFDSQYSIVHFPMEHSPPGHYTASDHNDVVLSQFQLLHTLIDYKQSPRQLNLFAEEITSDFYNEQLFQALSSGQTPPITITRINGATTTLSSLMRTAQHVFANGIPNYHEHLNQTQKDFLFEVGASLTLYFLGIIPKLHKVITTQEWDLARQNITDFNNLGASNADRYWVYEYRELALMRQVLGFFQLHSHPQIIAMISYGLAHDFSDEFANYPFQSGHNFCLPWRNNRTNTPLQ